MSVSTRSIRSVLRLSAVLTLAWGAAGCSTVDGWVDSVTGSSPEASTSLSPPSDQDGTADQSGGQTVAEASDQYPNIADQPDKAPPTSSTDEQKQVADGLTADRSQAQYSGDALRGGTEAAAAPPPPAPPPAPKTAEAAPPPPETAAADTGSDSDASADRSAGDLPTGKAPMPGALPSIQAGAQVASAAPATTPTAPPPAAVTTAGIPERAATPPPPPPPASFTRAAPPPSVPQSDAALGFQPSHAPPLDASVSQFVAPAVLDRYQQTAAMSSAPGIAGTSRVSHARRHVRHRRKIVAAPAATPAPASAPE